MQISGKSLIGNSWSGRGETKFKTFNPVLNEENPWVFIEANKEELERAVEIARTTFPIYSNTSDLERAAFLRKIADNIEDLGDTLLKVYSMESGLDETRARAERARTTYQLRMFADFILQDNWRKTHTEKAEPQRSPKPKPSLTKTFIPLGPIAVFGASNFPLAYSTAGGDTASALAVGCPVIVKSHPMHAGTGELIASAIHKAILEQGMPEGVFSNLNSQGIEVGVKLVNHQVIKGVGFTGSINGGRALMDIAARRKEPIPVFAEMGSVNPVIIAKGALINEGDRWAGVYADSITNGTGQFCTNPGLIIGLKSEALDKFKSVLARKVSEKISTPMLGPNIHDSYEKLVKQAIEMGAKKISGDITTKANYAQQTIVSVEGKEFLDNTKLHKEVFGPFSMIVQCDSKEELLMIIDQLEGQLTGTVIGLKEDHQFIKEVATHLVQRVGRIVYNGVPTGVEVTKAMNHGGPYPASSDLRFTAVGVDAVWRWLRPITYQNFPNELVPKI
jgi:alpha-ketoglutaric semialdehyde dehydrogenase